MNLWCAIINTCRSAGSPEPKRLSTFPISRPSRRISTAILEWSTSSKLPGRAVSSQFPCSRITRSSVQSEFTARRCALSPTSRSSWSRTSPAKPLSLSRTPACSESSASRCSNRPRPQRYCRSSRARRASWSRCFRPCWQTRLVFARLNLVISCFMTEMSFGSSRCMGPRLAGQNCEAATLLFARGRIIHLAASSRRSNCSISPTSGRKRPTSIETQHSFR